MERFFIKTENESIGPFENFAAAYNAAGAVCLTKIEELNLQENNSVLDISENILISEDRYHHITAFEPDTGTAYHRIVKIADNDKPCPVVVSYNVIGTKSYWYVVDLTFYAGSIREEDTDRKIVVFEINGQHSENDFRALFAQANKRLQDNEGNSDFPTYEDGLNIDTLIEGFCILANAQVIETNNAHFIDGIYSVEQWQ